MHEKSIEEITAETPQKPDLGKLLLSRREACGLSLEAVADRTHIRETFLKAFESGAYEKLPALPYAIGFLRQYATLLGLDAEAIVQDYRQATQSVKEVSHCEMPSVKAEPVRNKRFGLSLWPVIVMLMIAAVSFLSYAMDIGPWFSEHGKDIPVAESAPTESADIEKSEPATSSYAEQPVQTASPVEQNAPVVSPESDSALQTINLALPTAGGVFRIQSKGTGWVEIEADRRPLQNYDMQPGTQVDWTVRNFAEIRLNIQGGSEAWLDDRKLDLPDACLVIVGQLAESASGESMATMTAENHDEILQP